MNDSKYTIHKIKSEDNLPFELLLLADETKEAIEKYIYDADVFIVKEELRAVAVFVLYKINPIEVELKNIAVSEELQGKGIGSYLIHEILKIAKGSKYKTLIVGTPDVSFKQIRFYEKNGFKKYDMKKNFFIDNYTNPIIEDGIMLKDMVMLKIIL